MAESFLDLGLKVLIVDDVPSARLVVKTRLSQLGFSRIVEATNGLEALDILQKDQEIGLIISDWQMPELDGQGLLNRVYEDERLRQIPFVMATSLGEIEDKAVAALSGVWGYIVKPVTVEELKSELEDIFREMKEGTI